MDKLTKKEQYEDGGFRCEHQNIEIEPHYCDGIACACNGSYTIDCNLFEFGTRVSFEKLQARVLEVGSPSDCISLARFFDGADIKKLQLRVLQIGNAKDCITFAKDVDGADVKKLEARARELKEGNMETKKLTQAGRILKQLKDAGSKGVPNYKLANYNLGYRGRISDLRKDGHNIHCEHQVINGVPTGVWIYYLDDKEEI